MQRTVILFHCTVLLPEYTFKKFYGQFLAAVSNWNFWTLVSSKTHLLFASMHSEKEWLQTTTPTEWVPLNLTEDEGRTSLQHILRVYHLDRFKIQRKISQFFRLLCACFMQELQIIFMFSMASTVNCAQVRKRRR
jgi:hypothetical protein